MTSTSPRTGFDFASNVAAAHSLADLLRTTAAAQPDSPVVVGDGRALLHGELDTRSTALAAGLVAAGLEPGDRVAYLARNASEYWELFFATSKAGLVIVPMNFRLAPPEVEWIIGDAAPAALVVEQHLVELIPADAVAGLRGPALVFTQDESLDQVPVGWTAYDTFVGEAAPTDPRRDSTGSDLACLMYSSGTTGRPKA